MSRTRYVLHEKYDPFPRPIKRQPRPVKKPPPPPPANEERPWSLLESFWLPRRDWSDSKSLVVTQRAYDASVDLDWDKAMQTGHLSRYIQRHDRDAAGDGGAEGDGDGESDEELEEVRRQLAAHGALIYDLYSYYSAVGSLGATAADAIYSVQQVCFRQMIDDFNLDRPSSAVRRRRDSTPGPACTSLPARRGAATAPPPPRPGARGWPPVGQPRPEPSRQSASMAALDTIFITVDAAHAGKDQYNQKRSLNRQEWLRILVRVAIARHVLSSDDGREPTADVSEAVEALFERDIVPRLAVVGGGLPFPTNKFRSQVCYTEALTVAVARRLGSVRAIYAFYAVDARGKTKAAAPSGSDSLMSYRDWLRLCADLRLLSSRFTLREATLCFTLSRTHVID